MKPVKITCKLCINYPTIIRLNIPVNGCSLLCMASETYLNHRKNFFCHKIKFIKEYNTPLMNILATAKLDRENYVIGNFELSK